MVRLLGQTEAVSLVMVSGIVISLVGVAYFWGMPMIDKRASSTDFTSASNAMKGISDNIISLANAGGGRTEISLTKAITLVPANADDTDNNSLVMTYGANQPIIYPQAGGGKIYLGAANIGDTDEFSGVFGYSQPGIITVTQTLASGTDSYIMKTKLRMRQLLTATTPEKIYKIELCGESDIAGCVKGATGTSKLTLTFRGTETVPGNPDVVITKIGVILA